MNNITDKGLSIVEPEEGKPNKQSQITFQSLQEGDIFDKDIKRIMAIINGVEKQFNEKKITKDFQNALHSAYQRRVLKVDHDYLVSKTMTKQNASQSGHRKGKSYMMPDTYASVITGNLNQQSGDLNLASIKKGNYSFNNLPTSPKSHQATLLTNAKRQKMKGSTIGAFLDQNSNQDLKVDSQYF